MAWFKNWWSRPFLGGLVWLITMAVWGLGPTEHPWSVALLVLAGLVIVPLGVEATTQGAIEFPRWLPGARIWLIPAALWLVGAYQSAPGALAAILALPWVVATLIISLVGLLSLWRSRLEFSPLLAVRAGYLFLGVGGAWMMAERLGLRPLDFEPVIVLLTAVHFHYAGFALPLLTGLAARRLTDSISALAVVGSVAGVPLVAVGITVTQLGWGIHLEAAAATALALAGCLTAVLQLRLAVRPGSPGPVRLAWTVSALSLIWSMLLAFLYGNRAWLLLPWLDIPAMWVLHGTANALGFALLGLVAWNHLGIEPVASRSLREKGAV